MDANTIVKAFRETGKVCLKEGNGAILTLLKPDLWTEKEGYDWIFLLFDLFQIRSICEPFSEVSLDIVDFASKPTVYRSPANKLLERGPIESRCIRFSLIREPNWNKLLFQISHPVLVGINKDAQVEFETSLFFPLMSSSKKELYLGSDGEIKVNQK